jgi:hypothetical protein
MPRYEFWVDRQGTSFFPEYNEQARARAMAEGGTLEWEVVAPGWNSANQLLYDYLGYGVYLPMLQPDGTTYPQDEVDSHDEENEGLHENATE